MTEAEIYLFLGWLAAKGAVTLDYDRKQHLYTIKQTKQTIADLADEFIRTIAMAHYTGDEQE